MKFFVKTNEPALRLGRILGYKLLSESNSEYNFVRSFDGSRYPRFHIYVKAEKAELIFNLHLDQKKPSYEGQTAHSGEYDGELVEKEAERIRWTLAGKSS
ncbi:hypothetical protein HYV91_03245 [Candidatus Wolfebacteria bacterium]|nr:hypothetical protein [Candidatus Wolfebacteria bacterium]